MKIKGLDKLEKSLKQPEKSVQKTATEVDGSEVPFSKLFSEKFMLKTYESFKH